MPPPISGNQVYGIYSVRYISSSGNRLSCSTMVYSVNVPWPVLITVWAGVMP